MENRCEDSGFFGCNPTNGGRQNNHNFFFKTVDTNSYLSLESCHHKSWLYNIPKGQLIRLKRNCSKAEDFNEQAQLIGRRFEEKGYDDSWLRKQIQNVHEMDRNMMLQNKVKRPQYQVLFWTITYNIKK